MTNIKGIVISLLASVLFYPFTACAQFKAPKAEIATLSLEDTFIIKREDPKPDTLTVKAIGDIMMHTLQLEYDCTWFLKPIQDRLRSADIAIGNLEFTLAGPPYTGYPSFSAPDKYATAIKDFGIDVFLTANNHILDKGSRGFRRTLDVYRGMDGIQFTGSGGDIAEYDTLNPLMVRAKGINLALINFTYGTNCGASAEWPKVRKMDGKDVVAMIEKAKERDADFIIAFPHWGQEYVLQHNASQEKFAKMMVDNGVDLIIGGHPHHVQDTSHINGVPVIYSMGNAVSKMTAPNTRIELLVTVKFVKYPDGSMEMLEPELEFLWCTLPGTLSNEFQTIAVDDYLGKSDMWISKSDYDNMTSTLTRVINGTGIRKQ